MNPAAPIDRRTFLASVGAAGGSLALGFQIPFGPSALHATSPPREITAWIVIEPDDTVIIRVAKSEMGQGGFTALPMLVAEELECDWSKVKPEFAAPAENLERNRAWGDMSTGGSRSIRTSQDFLRRAGATAREMLIGAAAARWSVPASECAGGEERHHSRFERAQLDVRSGCRGGRPHRGAQRYQAQGPHRMEADRNAAAAARGHRQGLGQSDLRDRRAPARHAARRRAAGAGIQRQAEID